MLPLEVHGSNIWIKAFASCFDKFCEQSERLALSSNNNAKLNDAAGISLGFALYFGAFYSHNDVPLLSCKLAHLCGHLPYRLDYYK